MARSRMSPQGCCRSVASASIARASRIPPAGRTAPSGQISQPGLRSGEPACRTLENAGSHRRCTVVGRLTAGYRHLPGQRIDKLDEGIFVLSTAYSPQIIPVGMTLPLGDEIYPPLPLGGSVIVRMPGVHQIGSLHDRDQDLEQGVALNFLLRGEPGLSTGSEVVDVQIGMLDAEFQILQVLVVQRGIGPDLALTALPPHFPAIGYDRDREAKYRDQVGQVLENLENGMREHGPVKHGRLAKRPTRQCR